MTFSTRIAVYFMALVATVTAVLLGVMWVQKQQLQQSISDELNQQMHNRTAQILQPIYQLCNVQRSQTVPLLKQDLRNAHYLLSRAGNVSFSNDRVPWSNFTRTGNHAESLELPMLLVGGDWLGVNKDPLTPSPVVDDIKSLSSVDCSIYQRVNRKGDMLRVCTSIVNSKGFRDIGVYVPFRDQTGKINDLIQSVLKGETYIEQASAENHWMTIMGEPIFLKNSSQIVGMLSVERAQRNIADSIRKIILKTPVGKTGYMWVIGAKGFQRGRYIISKDGLRDGEDLWLQEDENGRYFIQLIVQNALQTRDGAVKFIRYPWINPGESTPRMKIAAFTYFEPWDWVIAASAYEDDFKDVQTRVDSSMRHMIYFTMAVSLAIILCSGLVGFLVMKTIDRFEKKTQENAMEIERISKFKSEFLANMSHELRTPLNAILGFSELMTRDANLTPMQTDNLAAIGRSGEHLLSLINDVLEFSKIEAGSLELHPLSFDLYKLMRDIEEMFRLQTREKGLTFRVELGTDVPQYICTDPNKLRQVLINLVSNSIKFTNHGDILLKTDVRDPGGSSGEPASCVLHFAVRDTGIGIASDKLDKIFDAFFQAHEGNDAYSGTGLGLAISQRFVRKMGGELTVESKAGRGSLFQFDIKVTLSEPTEAVSANPGQIVVGLEPGQPVYRVLIAEDNQSNRRMLFSLLQPLGFDLREAENGRQAVEMWQTWKPHLIWMDMRMPVMDGIEATRRIKANPEGKDTVIIALTGGVFEKNREKMITAGCDAFVRKPFRENELFEIMGRYLKLKYIFKEARIPQPMGPSHAKIDDETSREMAGLPPELRDELRRAATTLDYRAAKQILDKIDSHSPELSRALTQIIEAYQFDSILQLLENG